MLEAYRTEAQERAELGIPPKPLDPEWTAQLVDLLKSPPAGEEEFLLDLIANRVPPGVDEAAYVKAGFLSAIVTGEASSPLIDAAAAVKLLGNMHGGYNVATLVNLLDDEALAASAAEELKSTILVFDAFHDVAAKADAGNIDDDTGAPHNWDEGWAFFHGPDEHYGCSPAKVMEKRAADFGTADADGVAATFKAAEQAMVDGLAALQAGDEAGYDAATETVIKNIIITYSQATLKYTSKMDSTDSAEKYQAEGYAFWKTIEAYAAPYTDGCYNMAVHKVFMMGDIDASACDAFIWTNGSMDSTGTNDTCYNTVTHQVSTDVSNETECDGYAAMYFQDKYGAEKINEIVNLQDATKLGTSYDVAPHLAQVWAHYGITAADIGSMS